MDAHVFLLDFLDRVREDPMIGPSHISLYLAILCCYELQGNRCPLVVSSAVLMKQAKISATRTYHKCIKVLDRRGYIRYEPSFNRVPSSLVYLSTVKEMRV